MNYISEKLIKELFINEGLLKQGKGDYDIKIYKINEKIGRFKDNYVIQVGAPRYSFTKLDHSLLIYEMGDLKKYGKTKGVFLDPKSFLTFKNLTRFVGSGDLIESGKVTFTATALGRHTYENFKNSKLFQPNDILETRMTLGSGVRRYILPLSFIDARLAIYLLNMNSTRTIKLNQSEDDER